MTHNGRSGRIERSKMSAAGTSASTPALPRSRDTIAFCNATPVPSAIVGDLPAVHQLNEVAHEVRREVFQAGVKDLLADLFALRVLFELGAGEHVALAGGVEHDIGRGCDAADVNNVH